MSPTREHPAEIRGVFIHIHPYKGRFSDAPQGFHEDITVRPIVVDDSAGIDASLPDWFKIPPPGQHQSSITEDKVVEHEEPAPRSMPVQDDQA